MSSIKNKSKTSKAQSHLRGVINNMKTSSKAKILYKTSREPFVGTPFSFRQSNRSKTPSGMLFRQSSQSKTPSGMLFRQSSQSKTPSGMLLNFRQSNGSLPPGVFARNYVNTYTSQANVSSRNSYI